MNNTQDQQQSSMFPLGASQKTIWGFYERFFESSRMQMERNLRVMSESSEIARGNGEAMVTAACSAADGVAALAETTAQMSRRLIERGTEFSRTILVSTAVLGLGSSAKSQEERWVGRSVLVQ